jgi:hypothetical protein
VGEARQRVHLVHELRQLGGSEELLDGRDHRADVDQRLWGDRLDVLGGHALAHHALHAAEADAHLVLDQLAHRADAAVGEVVLVVEAVAGLLLHQVQQVADGGQHLVGAQRATAPTDPLRRAGRREERPSSMVHVEELVELGTSGPSLRLSL